MLKISYLTNKAMAVFKILQRTLVDNLTFIVVYKVCSREDGVLLLSRSAEFLVWNKLDKRQNCVTFPEKKASSYRLDTTWVSKTSNSHS